MRAETIETLRQAQRFGFLGDRPVEEAAEHAMAFAIALGPLAAGARLIDLGSGGGLPGLVLADVYPDCSIVLVDRRQKRTDFLARAVSRLGQSHVEVRCTDVAQIAVAVEGGDEQPFDAVTARGFGPPEPTLRLARRLAADEGSIVISEPPTGERWNPQLLAELDLESERLGVVRRFRRQRHVSRETGRG
jgi:16S rRNA (guanine527-N7)-methyltransferase